MNKEYEMTSQEMKALKQNSYASRIIEVNENQ